MTELSIDTQSIEQPFDRVLAVDAVGAKDTVMPRHARKNRRTLFELVAVAVSSAAVIILLIVGVIL